MLENYIEKEFKRLVEHYGGITIKLGQGGWPDRIVIWGGPTIEDGVVIDDSEVIGTKKTAVSNIEFVELKASKGKLSALQEKRIEQLIEQGQTVHVLTGIKGVRKYFED